MLQPKLFMNETIQEGLRDKSVNELPFRKIKKHHLGQGKDIPAKGRSRGNPGLGGDNISLGVVGVEGRGVGVEGCGGCCSCKLIAMLSKRSYITGSPKPVTRPYAETHTLNMPSSKPLAAGYAAPVCALSTRP